MSLIWKFIQHQKNKRLSKLPRLRRIFEHEAEPLIDKLFLQHKIRPYELRYARIINETNPKYKAGDEVHVLFYNKNYCEVQRSKDPIDVTVLDTNTLEFVLEQNTFRSTIREGEFVRLKQDIESDDELKGELSNKGDKLLIIKVESKHEYPYWAYNVENKEAFRIKESEIERLRERLPIVIS